MDSASATPTQKKKNGRTLFGTSPVQFTQSSDAALHRTGDSTVSPTPDDIDSISTIDEQMLEPFDFQGIPDSEVDIDLWNEFSFSDFDSFNAPQIASTTSVAANGCASAAQDQPGPGTSSVKKDPSSGKNQNGDRKQGKGRTPRKASYLGKLMANTTPKMPLGEYLQKTDGKLVCACGRGGHAKHHAGNKDYLDSIELRREEYRSLSRKRKEEFTNSLVREFREQGRRFLRLNGDDEWEEMDHLAIRRKVSQNFRDGMTPLPKEGKRRGPRCEKWRRSDQSDALVVGEEASQPTPPAA